MDGLTADEVKRLLDYNPETGIFVWKVAPGKRTDKIGTVAGVMHNTGHRRIRINGKLYYSHRLAWLVMTRSWPKNEIDHINNIRDDNRFCNLREATRQENERNTRKRERTSCKLKGVSYRKSTGKYEAFAKEENKKIHLGYFYSEQEAHIAFCKFADANYGDFVNYG
jgi:hypothetical protein